MSHLAAACLISILGLSASGQDSSPEGMVLVPAGEFVMGSEEGGYDEAPAHRVRLSAFYVDRTEVTNAEFARYVREGKRYDTVEGPWFRRSVEGCVDLLRHYRLRHGAITPELWAPAEPGEAALRRRRLDAARCHSAILALREQLGEETTFVLDRGPDLAALPTVKTLVSTQAALPVRFVTWRDAVAFARWAGKRLPTEAEWEKAARGVDRRRYPWGDEWDAKRCRAGQLTETGAIFDPYRSSAPGSESAEGATPGPAPVGFFPEGASSCGALDLAGNVWEWTADWYGERFYLESDGAIDPTGPEGLPDGRTPEPVSEDALLGSPEQGRASDTRKVIRGGSWSVPANRSAFDLRTTRRLWSNPSYWHDDVGFRCVKDVDEEPSEGR